MSPLCLTPTEHASLAERLYCAYNAGGDPSTAGLNFRGEPCPVWADLPGNVREKWEAVASLALDLLVLQPYAAPISTETTPTPTEVGSARQEPGIPMPCFARASPRMGLTRCQRDAGHPGGHKGSVGQITYVWYDEEGTTKHLDSPCTQCGDPLGAHMAPEYTCPNVPGGHFHGRT